jgi:hypothetical protein
MYTNKKTGVYGQYDIAPTKSEIGTVPAVEPSDHRCIELFTMMNDLIKNK